MHREGHEIPILASKIAQAARYFGDIKTDSVSISYSTKKDETSTKDVYSSSLSLLRVGHYQMHKQNSK